MVQLFGFHPPFFCRTFFLAREKRKLFRIDQPNVITNTFRFPSTHNFSAAMLVSGSVIYITRWWFQCFFWNPQKNLRKMMIQFDDEHFFQKG